MLFWVLQIWTIDVLKKYRYVFLNDFHFISAVSLERSLEYEFLSACHPMGFLYKFHTNVKKIYNREGKTKSWTKSVFQFQFIVEYPASTFYPS